MSLRTLPVVIGAIMFLAAVPVVQAQLDPNTFTSLGTLNVSSGTLSINTDTLTMSGAASFTGVALSQTGGPQVAVFDFSSITIGSGATISISGTRPLALLIQGNASIGTGLFAPASASNLPNIATLGGYAGGSVTSQSNGNNGAILPQNGGGPGGGAATGILASQAGFAGGGGYGGAGGSGGQGLGGQGGGAYGNLFQTLQGGSGGGAIVSTYNDSSSIPSATAAAGAGGGALEVVATGTLAVVNVGANGASGYSLAAGNSSTSTDYAQAGGGAGGGILLSGQAGLTLNGIVSAGGGSGAGTSGAGDAGGGGGGHIALSGQSSYTLGTNTFPIELLGGNVFGSGTPAAAAGVVTVDALSTTIPSGTSAMLNATPIISVAGSTTQVGVTVEAYIRHDLVVNSGATVTLGMNNALQHLDANGNNITSLMVDGTFNLNGFSQTVDAFSKVSGATGLVILPAGSTLTVGVNGSGAIYTGQLSGPGSFVKVGAGQEFMGSPSPNFTGQITITGGSLGTGDQSFPNATVVLAGGSLGFIFPNTPVLGALAGTGTVSLGGVELTSFTVGGNNASTTFGGSFFQSFPGGLIKAGTGTWTLTGTNTQTGPFSVQAGTILVASSAALSPSAPITVSAGATLNLNSYGYAVTSANSLTVQGALQLGGAAVTVAAGVTATYNGGTASNGFLSGSGTQTVTGGATLSGITTYNSTVISVTGAGTLQNFSNGGTLSVAAGLSAVPRLSEFTNQGSGAITVGAGSQANAANFQTYGMLTLTPNTTATPTILTNTGTSPLFFNGGSQTFIGTPATADPSGQNVVDYIDLHGSNAIVAGGLLVNNGGVFDTVGAGTGTIIAEFGALVKGAGFYQNTVKTQNGGKFQTGNSPGSATFGNFVFGPGGVNNYVFAIDDATGTAGPSPNASGLVSGWGLVKAVQVSLGAATTPGSFTWTATPSNALTVAIDTLVNPTTVGTDVAGPMADFDPTQSYSWTAARWTGSYAGPTDAATLDADTAFDTSGIINPIAGTFGWSLDSADQTLSLIYTPSSVPEPGTFALTALAALGWVIRRRCWKRTC